MSSLETHTTLYKSGVFHSRPTKVDGFVFWTKNAAPMLNRIHELDAFKYYFQYTITPYGRDVEKNIPTSMRS